jgi:O-antigen/teichoic acid export membrane protein
MLTVALTSVTGFAFWIVAARLFSSHLVGEGSALVAAMTFISVVCQLNMGTGILRFLPVTKLDPARAILAAYLLAVVASALGAAAFLFVAPAVADSYDFLTDSTSLALLFAFATVACGIFALQDAVLIALREAVWVPAENGIFGVAKILALPLAAMAGFSQSIFVSWVVPMALLLIPINYLIFARFLPRRIAVSGELSPIERFGRRGLGKFMAQDYLASILTQGSTTLVPVVVLGILGGSRGAYFYIPFTIVNAFDLLFIRVSASFTVEASMATGDVPRLVHKTIARFGPVAVGGVLALIASAGLILLPFGSDYSEAGTSVLRLLAAASLVRAGVALYCAICRVEGRTFQVFVVQAATFLLTFGLIYAFGARGGLDGVGIAWLLANLAVAVPILPGLVRLGRAGGDGG